MRILLVVLFSLFISIGFAEEGVQPLPVEQAFQFSAHLNQDKQLSLIWHIAPGYYLYRDQIMINPGSGNKVAFPAVVMPEGKGKQDTIRGTYQVYEGTLKIPISLANDKNTLILNVRYQGCAEKGFCYSPINEIIKVNLSKLHPPVDLTQYGSQAKAQPQFISEQETVKNIFNGKSFTLIVFSFLGLGLLLAFTPCVLPMIPILSGIIMGHRKKQLTLFKTFCLSLAYVLGMAVTYAVAGVLIALIGNRIQTELQRPWVIVIFSGIFLLMALSLFGLFRVQVPVRWQQRLTLLSNKQKGGTYIGVFLMGSISSLIATPCISPPLVGVLAYIAQSGDMLLGAMALLALGIGMGIPLLLIGASAGKLLPKAGPWMETIERLMGVMMLAFSIWILSRVLPGPVTLFLWSVLLICIAFFMGVFSQAMGNKQFLRRGFGAVIFVYGIILIIGAALGNSDPLHPWDNWAISAKPNVKSATIHLKDSEQLDKALLLATQQEKPVLIDFYADWCESCVRMERYVFTNPDIQQALSGFILLRADVTNNNDFDQVLLKRFNVIAPPTFIFFDQNGKEIPSERIIGEVSASKFLAHLIRVMDKET